MQGADADKEVDTEIVHTVMNPADVCTNALPGDEIQEQCLLTHVYLCHTEDAMGTDPENRSLSQQDEWCRHKCSQPREAEPEAAC